MEYQAFIKSALEESSHIALSYFGKVVGMTKPGDNNQVLTEADVAIGKAIIALIQKTYPSYNIIDEESGIIDNKSAFTWVIDPIDGTSNFAAGVPTYGIIIGLLKEGIPIAGGVVLPAFDETYVAEKGKGALLNNQRLSMKPEATLLSSLVAYGIDGHQENPEKTREECRIMAEVVLNIRSLRNSGSVFDTMMVAKGKYGAQVVLTGKIWDNVGLHAIIEEAGGLFTDFFGKPLNYSSPLTKTKDNFTICAATPKLHKELQQIIHQKL